MNQSYIFQKNKNKNKKQKQKKQSIKKNNRDDSIDPSQGTSDMHGLSQIWYFDWRMATVRSHFWKRVEKEIYQPLYEYRKAGSFFFAIGFLFCVRRIAKLRKKKQHANKKTTQKKKIK